MNVTTWTHPDLPPLTLKGSADESRAEAKDYFGEEFWPAMTSFEKTMSKESYDQLEEWSP